MQILKGVGYLIEGAKLLMQPQLRVFVFWPLLVNVIMFTIGLGLLMSYVSGWMDGFVVWLPSWLSGITWFLWTLFFGLFAMAVFWGFNLLANFIAAPFNGLLAEKVEQHLTGLSVKPTTVGDLMATIPRAIGREISKLSYYLPRVVMLLIISFIPGLNVVVPWLWLLFGAWMMAIQYVDYPMDNNGVKFRHMKQALAQERLLHLGFGGGVSLLLMVPLVNFFVMPIAVAGATALYVSEHAGLDKIHH